MTKNINASSRVQEYFCSDIVLSLSKKVLRETEIKVLEKGLFLLLFRIKLMSLN